MSAKYIIERVSRFGAVANISRGAPIFLKGERPAALFHVNSGRAILRRVDALGNEIVLHRVSTGSFLAEGSLFASVYPCSAYADSRCELTRIPLRTFRLQLQSDSTLAMCWIELMSKRLHEARARCEMLALKSSRARILFYIEAFGNSATLDLVQPVSHWAQELGLRQENVYRTLRAMIEDGTLRRNKGAIQVIKNSKL